MSRPLSLTWALAFLLVPGVSEVIGCQEPPVTPPAAPPAEKTRPIRIAIFDLEVPGSAGLDGATLTDLIIPIVASMTDVTIVNRDQLARVATEHQMALAGLADSADAVELGRFADAQYILVGRARIIGDLQYVVQKIVDVQTTVQWVVSAKAPVTLGVEGLMDRLEPRLQETIRAIQSADPDRSPAALPEALRKASRYLRDKVVLVNVTEEHLSRPLRDPAARMAVMHRLESLGIEVVVIEDPPTGWKSALMQTGRFGEVAVDYLIEGTGTSAFAAEIQNLVSCRARVELRLVPLPGHRVAAAERGIGAAVDLVEALAAKSALEGAATEACDGLLMRWWKTQEQASNER